MTIFARSDLAAVTVSAAHGGCGKTHNRPAPGGVPVQPWKLDCADGCEEFLRHDPMWSATLSELPETYDETRAREDFEKRGALDERRLMALALARLTGLEIPSTMTGVLPGAGVHLPGMLECPKGHAQPPGQKFCGECGSALSAPVAAGAIAPPQQEDGPSQTSSLTDASPDPAQASQPQRLQDAQADLLRSLARSRGLDTSGTRADLIGRLKDAGVSNADLRAFTAPVAA